jgi:UDP-N-acetyl-D-mannosaminuronate dehydrogenase
MSFMAEIAEFSRSNVAVFGIGYVGSVTAACLASIGHRVVGVDSDRHKIECINSGKAPFFEPGLEENAPPTDGFSQPRVPRKR